MNKDNVSELTARRRQILQRIETAEREMDALAARLEGLRAERDDVTGRISARVLPMLEMPISAASVLLAQDAIELEVTQ